MTTALETARANIASKYEQPYMKRDILSGGWDLGTEIKREVERIEGLRNMQEEVDE